MFKFGKRNTRSCHTASRFSHGSLESPVCTDVGGPRRGPREGGGHLAADCGGQADRFREERREFLKGKRPVALGARGEENSQIQVWVSFWLKLGGVQRWGIV